MSKAAGELEHLLSEAIAAADPDLSERIGADPSAHLDLVVLAHRAHSRTAEMLREAVTSARSAGHSWEAIGKALGMTRQAAQQRFGKASAPGSPTSQVPKRVLTGLTAFNEMDVLERAGRYGWHSVEYGPLYHVVERDEMQWEHRRIYAWSRNRASLNADGWHVVGEGWFPWSYYARPTGVPAIMEDISDEDLLGGK